MKNIYTIIIFILSTFQVFSQSKLYMNNEFTKAYQKNTRSFDGRPGKNYFVNTSDYSISAQFFPETGKLTGTETIFYHNNSNDTLNLLVVRLYKNIFKKGNNRDFPVNPNDINDGVKINYVKINGQEYPAQKIRYRGTLMFLKPDGKILPKSKTKLEISWEEQIPQHTAVRNGKYGDNYFVGYWYPQIAVYDDVFGWDMNSYTGAEEFYNDHCNFDVKITVQSPYMIFGSGLLSNYYNIFTKKIADRIKKAKYSAQVVKIISADDYKNSKILKKNSKITWHYKADSIPDFSFAVTKSHNWDAVASYMPDRSEPVFISAVYADSSKIFHTLAETTKKIINTYSFKFPKIYYPYPSMTVFEGGGAMEFPTMVNIGDIEKPRSFYYVVAHEVGHTYFPFFSGTNETVYAWMDEGLMSFFPRIATDLTWQGFDVYKDIISTYKAIAGSKYDLPIMTPADIYKSFGAYRNIAYNRPGYAFYLLYNYLGDSLFIKSLQEYVKIWHCKHPYPYDFFHTFEKVSGQDLSWFWKPFFFDFAKPDLMIDQVDYDGSNIEFFVINNGGIPLPINLTISTEDGKNISYKKDDISIWKNNNKFKITLSVRNAKKITLGNDRIPDCNPSNNIYDFNK